MRVRPLTIWLSVFLSLLCVISVQAATTTTSFQQGVNGYTGTLDTDLNANEPDRVQGSDDQNLADLNAPIAQALIRFENIFGTGPGQVPPGATIDSATLVLRTSNLGDLVRGFRVLVPWDETNTTWNTMVDGIVADGIEMDPTILFELDSAAVGDVFNLDVTTTVQGWYAGTFPNWGFGLTNSGGDGWQFNSSEFATVAFRPILTITFTSPETPVAIVTHPVSQTINEVTGSVTFSVLVTGTGPQFQWFKDGSPILDATNSTYTISRVLRTDAGAYTVRISNNLNAQTSNPATLTVTRDLASPRIECVYATNDNTTLFVVFSEIVTNAVDTFAYSVTPAGGGTPLTVISAVYGTTGINTEEGSVVVLTLDPSTPWTPPGAYNVTLGQGATDIAGNPVGAGRVVPVSLYPQPIFAISQNQIWRYLDPRGDPDPQWMSRTFDDSSWGSGPANLGVETAALPEPLRTQLTLGGITYYFRTHFDYSGPPGAAVLSFRTILDDSAVIYVNGVEVSRIRMPTDPDTYIVQGAGGAIGEAVYEGPFTVCVTNLVAGDNVIAASVHQIGTGSSDIVWGLELNSLTPSVDPVSIVTQPTGTNVNEPAPFTLRVVARGSSPQYQWFFNGTPIDSATNAIHTINPSNCDSNGGSYFVVISNALPSSVTSSVVNVTVRCDTNAPRVACLYGTNDVIVITFSEVVTNADFVFNYLITPIGAGNPLAVTSATFASGTGSGDTVLVVIDPTTPRDPARGYQIEISGAVDLFENPMSTVTMPIPFFAGAQLTTMNKSWRYNTTGTDLSNTWYAVNYNDTEWPEGVAVFDAKRPPRTNNVLSGEIIGTVTTLSNAANTAQIPTHYFRTHFTHSGQPSATVQLRAMLDDAAVYYLNGVEFFRVGVPAAPAPISYNTFSTRTVGDATNEWFFACVTNLVSGDNVLAVEVHNQSATSSDITFGTEMSIYQATPAPQGARLTITRGATAGEVTISWTGTGTLQANTDLGNPNGWAAVPGVTGTSFTTQATGNRFFRLGP